MSIIVTDGKVMVADSRLTSDEGLWVGNVTKLAVHGDWIMGAVGRASATAELLRQFAATGEITSVPHDCQEGLVKINRKKEIYAFEHSGTWYRLDAPYYAIGSGYALAMGALAMGASPNKAVRIAAKFDANCGLPLYEASFLTNGVGATIRAITP